MVLTKQQFKEGCNQWFIHSKAFSITRTQTRNCKKGSDRLKRWVEAQHNFFLSYKVFHDWSIIKLGNILYLLDGYIFAVLFETTSHCFC